MYSLFIARMTLPFYYKLAQDNNYPGTSFNLYDFGVHSYRW